MGEGLYRSVYKLLPTHRRKDSNKRKSYSIADQLDPQCLSLIFALSRKTKVQREHLDDVFLGESALWGLHEGQYVIVWIGSYEMNVELEAIYEFYDSVVAKTPPGWTPEAFWNLVAGIHLEKKGFMEAKLPTPVKIPLKVGDLLLMDSKTIHAGMPFQNARDLRGHLYWAQVADRDGMLAQDHTSFLWDTDHKFYPAWRFICHGREKFE